MLDPKITEFPTLTGHSGVDICLCVLNGGATPERFSHRMTQTLDLRGASTHSLDDKGRLNVPKRLLDQLQEVESNFILTASPDGCLLLVDPVQFGSMLERFAGGPLDQDASARNLRRLVLGHAVDVKPDSAGRILVPETLRQFMGLGVSTKEVVVVGAGEWVELWQPSRWSDSLAATRSLSVAQVGPTAG